MSNGRNHCPRCKEWFEEATCPFCGGEVEELGDIMDRRER